MNSSLLDPLCFRLTNFASTCCNTSDNPGDHCTCNTRHLCQLRGFTTQTLNPKPQTPGTIAPATPDITLSLAVLVLVHMAQAAVSCCKRWTAVNSTPAHAQESVKRATQCCAHTSPTTRLLHLCKGSTRACREKPVCCTLLLPQKPHQHSLTFLADAAKNC
jgi:hypothetical protein